MFEKAFRNRRAGAALLAVLALAAAACGSSSKSSTTGTTASSGGGGAPAAGTPYKVGWIIDLSGNGGSDVPYNDAFDSAIKAANAQGGIHGHPIDLITCDSQVNENAAAACGQQMVSDHVTAVLAESGEDTFIPYLQNAGIPTFDTGGLPLFYTSPVSFITSDTGGADVSGGYTALLSQAGGKSIVLVYPIPGAPAASVNLYAASTAIAAKKFGVDDKGSITVPASAPDLAPYETEATEKGAQCIENLAVGAQAISALKALG